MAFVTFVQLIDDHSRQKAHPAVRLACAGSVFTGSIDAERDYIIFAPQVSGSDAGVRHYCLHADFAAEVYMTCELALSFVRGKAENAIAKIALGCQVAVANL
jgi:hypothetical protein